MQVKTQLIIGTFNIQTVLITIHRFLYTNVQHKNQTKLKNRDKYLGDTKIFQQGFSNINM